MDGRVQSLDSSAEHLGSLGNVRDIPARGFVDRISVLCDPSEAYVAGAGRPHFFFPPECACSGARTGGAVRVDLLDVHAGIPDGLGGATRAEEADAVVGEPLREREEAGLVVNGQEGDRLLLECHLCVCTPARCADLKSDVRMSNLCRVSTATTRSLGRSL